jgi:hypothetical protein
MAYVLPTFNMTANIWRSGMGGVFSVVGTMPCNLALGRRSTGLVEGSIDDGSLLGPVMTLLVPPGTDLRDISCGSQSDVVEVPAGSGRWYATTIVDDIGKGFANEHRFATLVKVGWFEPWLSFGFTAWPAPIP